MFFENVEAEICKMLEYFKNKPETKIFLENLKIIKTELPGISRRQDQPKR